MNKRNSSLLASGLRILLIFFTIVGSAGRAQTVPPGITTVPDNKTVTVGANLTLSVITTGSSPLGYQWQFEQNDLVFMTNNVCTLTNLQFAQAGDYRVIVTNDAGSVTGLVTRLAVAPAFLKVAAGAFGSGGTGGAWGDFNNDGHIDLFVATGNGSSSLLYTNDGNGNLFRDTAAGVGSGTGSSWACAWGDFDNDGNLDIYGSVYGGLNYAFHNNGNGTFTKLSGDPLIGVGTGNNAVWGDFDNDGFLDVFCAASANLLFHNNRNGTFTKVTNSAVTLDGSGQGGAWGDYDNDGFPDLFVARVNQPNLLYHNKGDGTFAKVTGPPFSADTAVSQGCSWGDFDNDGLLDLVVCNNNARNFLYHNDGNGKFTKLSTNAIASVVAASSGSSWGDYDNDGFLDLFVAVRGGVNLLFHNNGDGSFSRVTTGTAVTENGTWIGSSWGDVNNDGFPDLFVGNLQGNNALYINGGNSNNWLAVTCAGRISNRAAIGAKVRVRATIHNRSMWQMREISGGGGLASQNDLRAQFGLGDATNVEVLRVEWPSGAVQELTNVAARQFLTMKEPCKLRIEPMPAGADVSLSLLSWAGLAFSLEASTDLTNWTPVGSMSNQTTSVTWTNPISAGPVQFFRAREF